MSPLTSMKEQEKKKNFSHNSVYKYYDAKSELKCN